MSVTCSVCTICFDFPPRSGARTFTNQFVLYVLSAYMHMHEFALCMTCPSYGMLVWLPANFWRVTGLLSLSDKHWHPHTHTKMERTLWFPAKNWRETMRRYPAISLRISLSKRVCTNIQKVNLPFDFPLTSAGRQCTTMTPSLCHTSRDSRKERSCTNVCVCIYIKTH